MRLILIVLLASVLNACGIAHYGDKGQCDSKFAAMQPKVDTLTSLTASPSKTPSTKAEVIGALGEPTTIYAGQNPNDPDIKDYTYLLYENEQEPSGYCGQYRMTIDLKNDQLTKIYVSKDYLNNQ
jgi:hypothetical protein